MTAAKVTRYVKAGFQFKHAVLRYIICDRLRLDGGPAFTAFRPITKPA